MKQFQFEYKNEGNFRRELNRIKRFCDGIKISSLFFQLFTGLTDENEIRTITDEFDRNFPDAYYYGCQSYGNIIDGALAKDNTLIVCSVFEYETTRAKVMFVDVKDGADAHSIREVWDYCNKNPWVKGVEIISSAEGCSLLGIDESRVELREDVQVFGGVAAHPIDITENVSYVFLKGKYFSNTAAIAVILGGDELHFSCFHIVGWEGLGKKFEITDCEGDVIRRLDNIPVTQLYKEFLDIDVDEHFFDNAMCFPLLVEENGVECIRIPLPSEHEGDVLLTVQPVKGTKVRLSYGNRSHILQTVYSHLDEIGAFGPETIRVYSCSVRRAFWGDENIGLETEALESVSATVGFYTHGELLRIGNYLHHFNSTMVMCLVREGEAVPVEVEEAAVSDIYDSQITLADRILQYLSVMSREAESHYNHIISAIGQTFKNLLLIDYTDMTITQLDPDNVTSMLLGYSDDIYVSMRHFIENVTHPDYTEDVLKFTDLSTLRERLGTDRIITREFKGRTLGWVRGQFYVISDDEGRIEQVIFATQIIDAEKRREERLRRESYTDGLTRLLNRRAFESEMQELARRRLKDNLVMVSFDVNGLKQTNDTLGHSVGDKLIASAAKCLKETFDKYGNVYRIGGDEFLAIINVSGDKLDDILNDFNDRIANTANEEGEALSFSYGYARRCDYGDISAAELVDIADEKMYIEKDEYYRVKGHDRRRGDVLLSSLSEMFNEDNYPKSYKEFMEVIGKRQP